MEITQRIKINARVLIPWTIMLCMQSVVVLSFFVVVVFLLFFYLYGSLWSENKLDLIILIGLMGRTAVASQTWLRGWLARAERRW